MGLAHVLSMPSGVIRLFDKGKGEIPVERIGFVSIPRSTTGVDVQGVSGGDGRQLARPREVPGLRAPTEIPSILPEPTSRVAQQEPESGSGPLVGIGGPRRGVRPEFRDPRLWREPTPAVTAPRSVRETIAATIAGDVARITDSVLAAGPRRAPGDWTVERNGRKYGVDPQFIRLGPVSIPTALLALLPMNVQANPGALERDRALSYMNADINHHARRAISEDEFRRNVRNLRERKDRERAERERASGSPENERERQEDTPAAPAPPQANY
ncbi:MAG TPA: hypothetical protein VMM17_04385 [Gemmatimonadaceae bacterium]|nr:hypothetical protein [Gemmatimonadaceae bacterium]